MADQTVAGGEIRSQLDSLPITGNCRYSIDSLVAPKSDVTYGYFYHGPNLNRIANILYIQAFIYSAVLTVVQTG